MTSTQQLFVALVVAGAQSVLFSGCATDRPSASALPVVDTLPSGVVRVRGPHNGVWTAGTRWRLVEDLRLGQQDGEGPEVFGEIWDITTDLSGRIYVIDRQAKEVRVFDRAGRYVRTLGRGGSGPGEFREPFGFAWDRSGRLWVVDVRLARYSVFDTAGNHQGEYQRKVGGFSWPWPGRFDRQGLLYESSFVAGAGQPILAFRLGEELEVSRPAELVAVDTFPHAIDGLVPGDFWNLQDERGIGAIVGIPFGRQSLWALDADAHVWVGHSGAYVIARRTLGGDTLFIIEREVSPEPVSASERARAIEPLGENANHPKMDLSRIPSTKPFFARLLPDDHGNLWVLRETAAEAWVFDVFAPDGGFIGTLHLPVTPQLLPPPNVSDNAVLVVTRDSLDVPFVVRFRIDRGGR